MRRVDRSGRPPSRGGSLRLPRGRSHERTAFGSFKVGSARLPPRAKLPPTWSAGPEPPPSSKTSRVLASGAEGWAIPCASGFQLEPSQRATCFAATPPADVKTADIRAPTSRPRTPGPRAAASCSRPARRPRAAGPGPRGSSAGARRSPRARAGARAGVGSRGEVVLLARIGGEVVEFPLARVGEQHVGLTWAVDQLPAPLPQALLEGEVVVGLGPQGA